MNLEWIVMDGHVSYALCSFARDDVRFERFAVSNISTVQHHVELCLGGSVFESIFSGFMGFRERTVL